MKCEHGRSLGIYCRECGPIKDRDSAPLQSGVIKPCPFCGENPRIFKWKTGWIVQCENKECGVRPETNEMDNLAEAEALWNGRVL